MTTSPQPMLSVVIPVFNSTAIVASTVDATVDHLEAGGRPYEVILVDDGSADASWETISTLADDNPSVVALKLLRNYGQHNANLCGLREARGDWVVTMDDDGQNPPAEIDKLLACAEAGHDVVFGRFAAKQAPRFRALGTRLVGFMNRRVFGQPKDLVVSNFRLLRRDVVDRITESKTTYPYITGQALLYAADPAHTDVVHARRVGGESTYTLPRIVKLVLRILFSYSPAPLHFMAVLGAFIAFGAMAAGVGYGVRGLFTDSNVEGWTTVVVLLSFLNGIAILMLSMLGEYMVRTLNQVSESHSYHVVDRVDARS